MSTAPTEAHIDLAVTIYKKRESFPPFDKVKEAAQLIADSEARAAEAANKRLGAQMNYVVALQRAIEHHAQGLEIPVAIGSDCPHHASMLNYALTASRERVRVLEEANTWQDKSNAPIERTRVLATYLGVYEPCVGSMSDSRFYADGQSGSEPFTHWMPLPTLAATDEKDGA